MQIQESLMTPVRGKYDAVVVGAGPAGASLSPLRALLPKGYHIREVTLQLLLRTE